MRERSNGKDIQNQIEDEFFCKVPFDFKGKINWRAE